MTTVASTSDQVKEVSSWIHDEGKCVSIGAVSTGLQLSRGQAQALLQQIADNPSDQRSYQVTKCFVSEGKERQAEEAIACTVFKLTMQPYKKSKQQPESDTGYLYALSSCDGESLSTAHERDMARLRDMQFDNDALDALISQSTDMIAPAAPILEQMKHAVPDDVEEDEAEHKPPPPPVAPLARGPKKATTAASFFQKVAKKTTKKKKTTSKATEDEKENNQSSSKRAEASVPNGPAGSGKKVGNADDFVGDVDDDEDEDDNDAMEVVRPSRKPRAGTRQPSSVKPAENDVSLEAQDIKVAPVSGAMDAFAKKTTDENKQSGEQKRKRRRKKLETKTSMDARGYLHTETVEVWEEIPSDEDEKESSIVAHKLSHRSAPAKKKASVNMKQGSLKGFFTTK